MKFWVTLEGHDAEVEFEAEGDRVWLVIEGRRLEADFHRLPDGPVYSLLVNGRSHELRVVSGRDGLEVTSHGTTIPVDVRHPLEKMLLAQSKQHGASGVETVSAPMPGLVVALRVRPGDQVAAGQAVAVVEAMKMQNELTAKHAGTVTEVLVAERASVAAGQALVRLHSGTS